MSLSTTLPARRRFLRGAGVVLGLPLLDAFMPRAASAQAAAAPPFVLLVVQGNGVVQAGRAIDGSMDPERFWPSKTGALTAAALEADKATRATGELAAYATRMSMYRGLSHPFDATGCMHASGDAQLLTASKLVGNGNKVLATGESADAFIARSVNPDGREPLALHAGKYSPGGTGFDIPGYVSYIKGSQPRAYVDSAYKAYQRVVGVVGTGSGTAAVASGPSAEQRLAAARSKSVNDLLRSQIQELLARKDLSQADRQRLDQHFTSVRDLEVATGAVSTTATAISEAHVASMQRIDPKPYDVADHFELAALHMRLMAFAVASGYTRVAVLKIGDREDDHQLTIDGRTFVYHTASHRGVTDGANLCSKVDFMHMQYFKGLLDHLDAVQTPVGSLLDTGVTVWTNQVGNGNHVFTNIPWILVGKAGGYLKTGQFADVTAKMYKTNRMLNTLINAAGVRGTGGAVIDNFGDATLAKGVVDEALA
jgi:hypothetical protein